MRILCCARAAPGGRLAAPLIAVSVVAIAGAIAPCAEAQSDQEEAVVVTATRFPEQRLQAPVGTMVITRADIAQSSARTLPQLLADLAGLQIRDNSGSPDQQLDLRGFGMTGDQNTLVLLDGVRLNANDLSTTPLSSIPLQAIERIEILRGSGAVLYGGGATGGTINIVTRGPRPGQRALEVFGGAGSYGTGDARATVNLAGERWGTLFAASHLESDNYRANNRLRQDNFSADIRLFGDASGGFTLKLGSNSQHLALPGARDANQLVSDPRGATTPSDWSTRDGDFLTASALRRLGRFEFAADFGWREQVSSAYFVSFGSFLRTPSRNLVFSPRLRWNGAAFGRPSDLVFGLDWNDWDYHRDIAASPADIGEPFARTAATQKNRAVYFQYNLRLSEALKFTLGARRQRVEDSVVQSGFAASSESQVRTPTASEVALQYRFAPGWMWYGKTGTSFRTATVDDNALTATGHLLEPQTARQNEIGVQLQRGRRQLRLSAYVIDLQNEIYFSPLVAPAGSPFPGSNVNLAPTRREGIELFVAVPLARFDLSASLVLQSAKFRSGDYGGFDVSGRDVPLVPRALASVQAALPLSERSRIAATLRYVGRERYDNDQANTFPQLMPAYALADLKFTRAIGGWNLSATVSNLFDKKYYSYAIVNAPGAFPVCATAFCAYPQPGRSVFLSIERLLR